MIQTKITEYLDSVKDLRPETIRLYRNALNPLIAFHRSTNNFQLKDYANFLRENKCSGKTIQQYLTIAKMFLKWNGTPAEYTYRIPASERKQSQLKAINRWFTEADVEKCKNYKFPRSKNPLRNRAIVHLLIDTGARVREISRIKAKDINVTNKTVFLSDSKTEPRSAFFSEDTANIISAHKQRAILNLHDRLFPSTKHVRKIVNDMLIDLELKKGADGRGPHTFRHYVATWLHYEGGMSIMDIAFLLGDTPGTIRDNYIHPTSSMLQRRVNGAMEWH
jgi:integrase